MLAFFYIYVILQSRQNGRSQEVYPPKMLCAFLVSNCHSPWNNRWPVWSMNFVIMLYTSRIAEHAVACLVEALCYKPEGAASIPSEVIRLFNWANVSSQTVALGSTQMSMRNLPAGKRWPARKADNLIFICADCLEEMWVPRRLTTLWVSMACYRDSFTLYLTNCPTE
jgi:hypothetical protein